MADDLKQEIRALFDNAALRNQATKSFSGEDWAAYRKLQENHSAQVRLQERRFELEYQTRLELARQRIIDQGGAREKNLVHRWFGSDKFNAAAIDRQAHREIHRAHEGLLARMDSENEAAIEKLFRTSGDRQSIRDQVIIDFAKATDRRSGPDRRGPSR